MLYRVTDGICAMFVPVPCPCLQGFLCWSRGGSLFIWRLVRGLLWVVGRLHLSGLPAGCVLRMSPAAPAQRSSGVSGLCMVTVLVSFLSAVSISSRFTYGRVTSLLRLLGPLLRELYLLPMLSLVVPRLRVWLKFFRWRNCSYFGSRVLLQALLATLTGGLFTVSRVCLFLLSESSAGRSKPFLML